MEDYYICEKCKKKVNIITFSYIKNSMHSKNFRYLLCDECVQELREVINNWLKSE